MLYIEQTMAGRSPAEAAAPAAPQPSTPAASERTTAQQRSEETGCSGMNGSLPGALAGRNLSAQLSSLAAIIGTLVSSHVR